MNKIVNFMLNKPKTYVPLMVMVSVWVIDILNKKAGLGVPIDETLKESLTVICTALALGLMRRNTVKSPELEATLTELKKEVISESSKLND